MKLGRLAIRGIVGPLFVGHGTQKLFGWFGGHGLEGTAGFFEGNLGLRPGKRHATAAGLSEAVGGALLTVGALTPLASSMIIGAMTTAIRKVHAPKGPWVTVGGYEYNAVLIAAMVARRERPGRAVRRLRRGAAPQGHRLGAARARRRRRRLVPRDRALQRPRARGDRRPADPAGRRRRAALRARAGRDRRPGVVDRALTFRTDRGRRTGGPGAG